MTFSNRSTTPAKPAGGRRKATRAEARAQRPNPFAKVPALPTVVGAVALVTAAGGAIGLGHGLPGDSSIELSSGAAKVSGTIDLSKRDPRAQAISRDSHRQAIKDAAKADLKAAAEQQSEQRNAALESLAKDAEARADQIAENRWVAPVSGYRLTARFGQSSGLWSSTHTGLDFAGSYGSSVKSIANGTVTGAGYDGSYGNKITVTLDDGTEIWYCHLSHIGVSPGTRVTQGEQIGNLGNTGNSTGPHLHVEVRPGGGDPVDPYYAFIQHGLAP